MTVFQRLARWMRLSGKSSAIRDESTVKCPSCGFAKTELMPADVAVLTYVCKACGQSMPAAPGLCVFCFYGTSPCGPRQQGRECRAVTSGADQ